MVTSVYSSGASGRLVLADVAGLINYLESKQRMSTTTTTAGELNLASWRRHVTEFYATFAKTPTASEKSLGSC